MFQESVPPRLLFDRLPRLLFDLLSRLLLDFERELDDDRVTWLPFRRSSISFDLVWRTF